MRHLNIMINSFINKHRLSDNFNEIAKEHFIPLSERLRAHQLGATKPYFVGINGSQGSGKSTLSAFIQSYLQQTYALKVVVMSLDDFYFSQVDRHIIAQDVHPLFETRGVPGTHNMSQAKGVLNALKSQQKTIIPRFNKATDNPHNQADWTKVPGPVDIVLFEGWCWGVEPQTAQQLIKPINDFERQEDSQSEWRNHSNLQLTLHHKPLYQMMDKWIMLKAPSFADIFNWRLEQEQKLIESTPLNQRHHAMDKVQVERFIQHYQRLTEHALNTLPDKCDEVFSLNPSRAITAHQKRENYA